MDCSILSSDVLGYEFHGLFKENVDGNRRKSKKKPKKKSKQARVKERIKNKVVENVTETPCTRVPCIEVCSNPSAFAVFAGVRQAVLDKRIRETSWVSPTGEAADDGSTDSDNEGGEEGDNKESTPRIPKVVGIGLCSVFELIRESRFEHPALCTRALEALLDILQGQQPEGLRKESSEVIDALFSLLLELASQPDKDFNKDNSSVSGTSLMSVACSCLLSLVVARGDTGKLLSAAAAILMSHGTTTTEDLKMSAVLMALQRSIHAVLLGKTVIADWVTNGILKKGLIDVFYVNLPEEKSRGQHYSMVSDGKWIFILSNHGNLYKVGSGYGGTVRGHIAFSRSKCYPQEEGWLGFAEGRIFYKPLVSSNTLVVLNSNTLEEDETVCLDGKDVGQSITFSDGEFVGTITSTKDDSFVVRTYSPHHSQMPCVGELPLKLARRCLDLFGWAPFDEEMEIHTITSTFQDEPATIAAGKDFSIIRTTSGKIMYTGKAQSLGIKQGGAPSGRWVELPVNKSFKVVHFSVGHEGLHCLFVTEDGSVFFAGIARRGEDGDQNKGRRQPKPVKPKKMVKVESLNVVSTACNNGTSALVTRDGEVYMFGKDTTHCHHPSGFVTELKDIPITQVALGKAHVVALSDKGQIYTFGINNKGQCGRDFVSHTKDAVMSVAMATTNEDEDAEDEELEVGETDLICPAGRHKWKQDECMVCTVCGECTGFGVSCISKGQPDRNLGLPCGCGWGDSGCSECGCCKACAGEKGVDSILAAELDIIMRRRPGNRLQDQIQRKLDERRHRNKSKTGSKSSKVHVKAVRPQQVEPSPEKGMVPALVEEVVSSDQEREASKITSLPPAMVPLSNDLGVAYVTCGLHHTVLLTHTGEVFTFGSNQYGQLGVGDVTPRGAAVQVRLPAVATHIASGSNHTVVLLSTGLVFTFGSYQKGQLGRLPPSAHPEESKKDRSQREAPWFSVPGAVPHVGPKYGRRPTWVGASGDQTFLKIDESLINAHNLANSTVVANHGSICLIPTASSNFKNLMISRVDGNCRSFNDDEQVDLSQHSVCLDPAYNVIWSFDPATHQMSSYNAVAAEVAGQVESSPLLPHLSLFQKPLPAVTGSPFQVPYVLTPTLATPSQANYRVTRSQAALHLLSCLDTLSLAHDLRWKVKEEEGDHTAVSKVYNKEDFSVANRFDSHGGGWGYSGHSVEAIRFMPDTDLLLGGFGLFGGRGEYTGKLRLYDVGMEGGDHEIDGELLSETEEIPYECGARQKFQILFDEPIVLQASRWYVAWARVSGPSSDCGSSGQSVITTEDQVSFYFKSSKKSNNGTDVNAGQIPQILYKIVLHENQVTALKPDACEPVYILSKEFYNAVTPDGLQSLLKLLEWGWLTFKKLVVKVVPGHNHGCNSTRRPTSVELEQLVYICCACLRLLRAYINEIYPNTPNEKKAPHETARLVENVADTRTLLRCILSDPSPLWVGGAAAAAADCSNSNNPPKTADEARLVGALALTVLEECHTSFVACFHAFYPTAPLKWACLCNLLVTMNLDDVMSRGYDRLLAAILASLCSPALKLSSVLPICEMDDQSPSRPNTSASCSVNSVVNSAVAAVPCDSRYPILVEHMVNNFQLEDGMRVNCSFKEVLDRLLAIVVRPVKLCLGHEKISPSAKLEFNTCALLAAIVAELAAQTTGIDAELHSDGGRQLYATQSRFTRMSQSRTWNTGNGSPDAICFSVDRSGIVIAGVTLYGGVGSYDYELELLDDQNGSNSDPSHTQRWNSLEIIRGTFGPDDCVADMTEVKFDHPVSVKENVKYAIRLRNHGGRTSSGDGGLVSTKGLDGTVFTFSACSLSFNGTNHTRGQIPQILYYSTPHDSDSQQCNRVVVEMHARRNALSITSAIVKVTTALLEQARDEDVKIIEVLASAHVTSMLLPLVLAHVAPIVTADPRSAVHILEMIRDILPPVAHLNNQHHGQESGGNVAADGHDACVSSTTSNHYAIVESDHPYKPATVSTYKVCFPDTVKWMSLEFDSQCGTAQSEDALQLYIPSREASVRWPPPAAVKFPDDEDGPLDLPYWTVLHKFSSSNSWPHFSVILPGNEVVFSLETASDYIKDEKASFYGFKCVVVGYDWKKLPDEGLKHLEEELAYLGGLCASSLIRKDLLLPPVSVDEMEDDLEIVDEIAHQIHHSHGTVLGKGFAVTQQSNINQALEGIFPLTYLSNERSFLKDFVLCTTGTSGGRLARWLQPDSYVDPRNCVVVYSREEMRCGWPTVVGIVTKDQYGEVVNVFNLKLEVKAVPIDKRDRDTEDSNRKVPRVSKPDSLTFGGYPLPNITVPYGVTVKDKMCYYAISMMKAYDNYSFEELRYTTPPIKRPSENMMVRANGDGTYSCNWTPGSVGCYHLRVSIDGFEIENTENVEVKDPPQGVIPPSQALVRKSSQQVIKVKRFVAKHSAGLRVRAHPSLQSDQIGTVYVDGIVAFVDEFHNDDGVWVRLSQDAVKRYCHNNYSEAWCLQYNQHLGQTLLLPLEECKGTSDETRERHRRRSSDPSRREADHHQHTGGPGGYTVVKCGASGHNIRSSSSLKAPPVGMLVLGNQLTVVEDLKNVEGIWVKLDKDSMRHFCFNTDGEAWSLARSRADIVYLQHEDDQMIRDTNGVEPPLVSGLNDAGGDANCEMVVGSSVNGAGGGGGRSSNFWNSALLSPVVSPKPFDFSSSVQRSFVPAFGPTSAEGQAAVFTFGPSEGGGANAADPFQNGPTSSPGSPFAFGSSAHARASYPTSVMAPAVPPKPVIAERKSGAPHPPQRSSSVLQKWFHIDEPQQQQQQQTYHRSDPIRTEPIGIPLELYGVSVRELVKVLGESRANGNEATPPHTPPGTPPRRPSRSSSPKAALVSSPRPLASRESSPVPALVGGAKGGSPGVDSKGPSPAPATHPHGITRRMSAQTERETPNHPFSGSPLALRRAMTAIEICDSSEKSFVQAGTQTSPDGKGHFSIGSGGRRVSKEEVVRLSPKLSRKDRAVRQLRSSKRERTLSPTPAPCPPTPHRHRSGGGGGGVAVTERTASKEPVKCAMSPLVAESLRAVFAAFLWHEGIVHDAMTCSSYLRFHPDLPKRLLKVPNEVANTASSNGAQPLSREQKARLRHSVEVSASNLLTIHAGTAEAFARSLANANINKNKMPLLPERLTAVAAAEAPVVAADTTKGGPVAAAEGPAPEAQSPTSLPEEDGSQLIDETKARGDLPASLQDLLVLWEGLVGELLKVMSHQFVLPLPTTSPTRTLAGLHKSNGTGGSVPREKESERRLRKKKEWRMAIGRGNLFGEAAGNGAFASGPDRETMCELCGNFFTSPVTYHMRKAHPGCGCHAGGMGYNSGGHFCGGWAGNCGDGGIGGSSWYLICDRCREKYLRQKRQSILKERGGVPGNSSGGRRQRRRYPSTTGGGVSKASSSPLPPLETHLTMKQNASFLLDLASAGGSSNSMITSGGAAPAAAGVPGTSGTGSSRRSPHGSGASGGMPSVDEQSPMEAAAAFAVADFQCLRTLGVHAVDDGGAGLLTNTFLLEETLRKTGPGSRSGSGNASKGCAASAEDGMASLHSLTEDEDGGGYDDAAGGFSPSSEAGAMLQSANGESESPRGRLFHRSISVGTTTREWNREEGDGRIIMTRKRNKSSGEGYEDGFSLLCHPSQTLTKLVALASDKSNPGELLTRPVLAFVLQRHDLHALRLAMQQAARKAACRAYAMQGLNWLIRNVTQPSALHDLLWFFVASLTPAPDFNEEEEAGEEAAVLADKKESREHEPDRDIAMCDHPVSDITIAGDAVRPLVSAFHTLLQSVSDLMMMLPMSSSLQQVAMRCWCLKFHQSDHVFLHRSQVFSNISKILSRSEDELCGEGDGTSSMGDSFQSSSVVEHLRDLTPSIEIKASSRPAMINSLTDNSTETFWESGDEDRNKSKVLTLTLPAKSMANIVYIHVDNGRDLGNKVFNVSFKAGSHADDLVKLRQLELENRYAGWVSCPIPSSRPSIIRLELRGPDNTLRVRQVKVMGEVEGENARVGKVHSAAVVQQRNCEAETLKVFRLLTSQVFGRLILSDPEERDAGILPDNVVGDELLLDEDLKGEGNNDLKEHMVGILFSRSKLTHLQKQVCTHIVQAIRKEASRVREEWEALLCSKSLSTEELPKSSDAYCFEMLSMVLALSGSGVGRVYLAQQYSLLKDLLSLLHTGSARVQRQVISLLRRVLPEVSPPTFAQMLGVKSLPPADYSIVSEASKVPESKEPPYDVHRPGVLDVFFSCIAKSLTVQMKVKGKETNKGITMITLATSIHPRDFLGSRWWLRGCITRKLAEMIIQLLQDMATGKLSEAWAATTKGAVAESILNLTKLDEKSRTPSDCLKTPTMWLALASLCVLDRDHVERLSSGQWVGAADGQPAQSRPTCDNHDDHETLAIILCTSCGNLCADCDRFLHLHRRTHGHQRQVFKEEEEAIRVDLHEGCGRTKLFWVMALADSKTLKAMIEFREGARGKSSSNTGTCRFCGASGDTGLLAIGNVCADAECQEHARWSCTKSLPCGHMCGGLRNEATCLPCLHGCSNEHSLKQDADDMCMICFTEALSCAPAIQLNCGHVYHFFCCRNVLNKRWAGPRITFSFSLCPICKSVIEHPVLKELLEPVRALHDDVRRKALMRLEYEGLHNSEAIVVPKARFHKDPAGYAMERYAYYVCFKCQKAYYGGEARCDIEAGGGDDYDPAELVCGGCSDVSRAQMCPKHGTDYLEYKCRYCCSVAVFFCFGTTHFCNACHDDFQHVTNISKAELPHCPAGPKGKQLEDDDCPLHIVHPPTGEEFALGCGVCRNAHTF